MVDIYCKDNKCPICNSEMKIGMFGSSGRCLNKCYGYSNSSVSDYLTDKNFNKKNFKFAVTVGWNEEYYSIGLEHEETGLLEATKEKVIKNIEYWKENDRYLMKILEGNKND